MNWATDNKTLLRGLVGGFFTGCATTILLSPVLPDFRFFLNMLVSDIFSRPRTLPPTERDGNVKSVLDPSGTMSQQYVVMPSQIDRNGHMNNAKYINQLNFSRRMLFNSLGLWSTVKQLGVNLIIQAQAIRYRKELCLWQRYTIQSKILSWSKAQRCYYVESRFLAADDAFVLAIHYAKYRLVPSSKDTPATYLSPVYILKQARLLPAKYSDEKESKDPGHIQELQDLEKSFIDYWEEANVICSKNLNPNKTAP